ncbi:MAG: 1,4-dihydroxy-2-naphthoate octaprenyltransferase [bacterium]|nr:MAG: 1,4-dihydroxy-2-naphthoate octaprenyltransferase [bacterium]
MPAPGIVFKELRAEFLTASVMPVLVSTVIARYETGLFDPLLFTLTLAGAVFIHLGTNVANDYYDNLSGTDVVNVDYVRPFTGGSRLIQEGLITPRAVLTMAIVLFAAGAAAGVILTVMRGPVILLFALAGIVSGYFYTAPPFKFAHRGFGEFLVGLNFGLLIFMGTYYVQTGTVSRGCIIASLPLTFLVTAIILINEFQDSAADAQAGKRTLVVRVGNRNAVGILTGVVLHAYLPIPIAAAFRILPPLTLIGLATLPLMIKAILTARVHHSAPKQLAPANALTITSHLVTGILLSVGYLFT